MRDEKKPTKNTAIESAPTTMRGSIARNPTEVLPPLSEQLNEEICHSMSLINSSVNALHSQIQSVVKSEEENDVHFAIHKMQATAFAAKGISELLKAKMDIIRFIAPRKKR